MHQRRRIAGDRGLFLKHLALTALKGQLGHAGAALDRRRSAEYLLELSGIIEVIEVTPDGGLGGIQRLGKLGDGDGVTLAEDL